MSDLSPRHGPLSTIAGWMTLIAVIGVAMGLLVVVPGVAVGLRVVAPPVSFLVVIGLIQTLAARRFMSDRRGGKPMSGCVEAVWILALSIVIPILSAVALIGALIFYYSFMAR